MRVVVKHEKMGEFIYEENFWNGNKKVFINEVELVKTGKNAFQTAEGKKLLILGNFFTGLKAFTDEETIKISEPCKWYEYLLSFLPMLLIIIWGNTRPLTDIIPIIGGAVGGAICGLFGMLDLVFIHYIKNIWLKILISIVIFAVSFLFCFLIAEIFLAIL